MFIDQWSGEESPLILVASPAHSFPVIKLWIHVVVAVAQSLSHVWLFLTPWTAARQASLSFTKPQLAQTHVPWVGDAIQPSHPLSSPSPPAFNHSQNQGLSQWVSSLHQVAKGLEWFLPMNIQNWYPLGLTSLILQSKGLSRVFSNNTVKKHQFFSVQPSLWSHSHIYTWLLEKP